MPLTANNARLIAIGDDVTASTKTGARADLPSGTVTFLFTDIEGSTRLLRELGEEGYSGALAEHRRVLREAFTRHRGVEVDTQGDAFFVAFPTADGAIAAAKEAQDELATGPIRVRIGIHTGRPHLAGEGYVGHHVHKAARIAASAHGGQVVLSRETRDTIGDADTLSDLGEHRVKDFADPVWLFQLGTDRFPPLRTISNTNLPRPAGPFIGRDDELSGIAALLRDGARLLTLTGPGGTGKTRLAIEAAATLVPDFRNGVFWVDLAPLREPALLPETIGQTIGAKDGLAEHVGDRQMLLLLDNFEQLVGAAPEVATLVEHCPNLRLLVTSRELLRVRGEVEYAVPPLTSPEAVQLFYTRAAAEPSETITELCRRLDNLPLAIELAAARSNVLSPAQILARLASRLDLLKGGRDADARQQTLRSTISWSHDLLDAGEQQLFARLAVFRGGWSVDAAESIVDADLDTLQSLVEKSLVSRSGERFSMLETIREYAVERLDASGEAATLWPRHASWFLALARALPREREVSRDWLDTLEREQDNLRAAFDRLERLAETRLLLELAESQWRFWKMRGYVSEGRERLGRALAAEPRRTAARGHALNAAVGMAVDDGDFEAGRRQAEEALAIHREVGDEWGIARATYMLGYVAIESGDFARAKPLFEEAMELFRRLSADHFELLAAFNLSWAYDELGDSERARILDEESLRRARAAGNAPRQAAALDSLAGHAMDEGRLDDALPMLRESLAINRELGDVQHQLDSLSRVAKLQSLAAETASAARLLSASLALHEELGLPVPLYQLKRNETTLARIHERLDDAAFDEAWQQGAHLRLAEAVELALGRS